MTEVDTVALRRTLAAELDATVVDVRVLHEGVNLSVAIATEARDPAYVLRRPRKLRDTDIFNDLASEYRLLARLADTPIPAPEPVLFCDDESVIGDPFLVVTHRDGEAVPLGSDLPDRFRDPASRERVAHLLVDTLAAVHTLDTDRFADVCERVTPRDQVDRTRERLERATAATGLDARRLRSVGEWLRQAAPTETETSLVHGDYRPGNVLFGGTDTPVVTGVLDWETALLGDPLTELGYLLLRWRDDGDPTPSLHALAVGDEEAMSWLRAANQAGLAPFTARPGSPTRPELVARYEDRAGVTLEHERFYVAHAAFGLAVVWADLHRHEVLSGTSSDRAPGVEYMAMLAEFIVRGEWEL